MPVTIKEIARLSGLSYPTVSQILNNRPVNFRQETRDKVLEIARKLGYRPNAYARAMSRGKFGAIGLLLSRDIATSALFGDILYAMEAELRVHDAHLVIGDMPDEQLVDQGGLPKVLREWSVDGLLINYTHDRPRGMDELIARQKIPAIWINTRLNHDCIYPDDQDAGRRAAEHVLAMGHRRLAFASFTTTNHYSLADRFAGAEAACRAAGVALKDLRCSERSLEGRIALLRRWLTRPLAATAILCHGRDEAISVVHWATRLGIDVPRELSIICFFQEPLDELSIAITQLQHPMHEMGTLAVRMLMQKIDSKEPATPAVAVPFALLPGQTCAPPPAE
jgi:LacI family transcriptional regulator